MTAKEKAKLLINKFRNYVDSEIDGEQQFEYSKEQETSLSKKCALIAVEEIIASIQPAQYRLWNHNEMMTEFWDEVKQEIEKL